MLSKNLVISVGLFLYASTTLGDLMGNGEAGTIDLELEKKMAFSIERYLEQKHGKGIGINQDLKCLKHTVLPNLYCISAYSTGGGTLGVISLRFNQVGDELVELDRSEN